MYAITLSTIATLTHNTTPITMRTILTMQHPTMTTKIIAVQTQILEDAADIEDNILDITEAYSTILAYRTKSVCENPYNTRYLLVL